MKKLFLHRFLFKLKDEENGTIVVFVAIAMVLFMNLLAVTLDIGSAYLSTGNIQTAADAAVYSAGKKLPVASHDTASINAIKDSAIYYAGLNGCTDLTRDDVVLGNLVQGNYTDMKVTIRKNVEMNFAKVFGVNSIHISRSAKIKLSPKSRITGAVPLGIRSSTLDEIIQSGNTQHVVLKYGAGGSVGGFFGALDLDGRGGGASDYRLWIAHGYPGEVVVGDILLYEYGNMTGPTYQGFSVRYNACTHFGGAANGGGCTIDHYDPDCPRVAKVIVYSVDSYFVATVKGFAAFVLESQTNDGFITGSFVKTLPTGGESTGENAGSSADYGAYSLMLSE